MRFGEKWGNERGELKAAAGMDAAAAGERLELEMRPIDEEPRLETPEVRRALANFRLSVQAWSAAELSRARPAVRTVRQRSWRLAVGWALGCALAAGSVGGGLYEHHHRLEAARMAAARAAEQQRQMAAQRARVEDADLMAAVDKDVSQEVPSAMEPLARLMAGDESQ